jgi:hypothetical protein
MTRQRRSLALIVLASDLIAAGGAFLLIQGVAGIVAWSVTDIHVYWERVRGMTRELPEVEGLPVSILLESLRIFPPAAVVLGMAAIVASRKLLQGRAWARRSVEALSWLGLIWGLILFVAFVWISVKWTRHWIVLMPLLVTGSLAAVCLFVIGVLRRKGTEEDLVSLSANPQSRWPMKRK